MFLALFASFDILGPVLPEKGVSATLSPLSLGSQNPNKNLAHVGVFLGQLLSQNKVSKIFRLGPLP